MIELEPSCQIIALPSIAPDANIFEFFDEYKLKIAALGLAFCFLIKFLNIYQTNISMVHFGERFESQLIR